MATKKSNHNHKINQPLIDQIANCLHGLQGWGSVEIFVQDHKVIHITAKSIIKLNNAKLDTKISSDILTK